MPKRWCIKKQQAALKMSTKMSGDVNQLKESTKQRASSCHPEGTIVRLLSTWTQW